MVLREDNTVVNIFLLFISLTEKMYQVSLPTQVYNQKKRKYKADIKSL